MVQPGSGRFSQTDREELDDEQIFVRSPRPTHEALILELDARVGFAVKPGDVVRCSKSLWETGIMHGASEHLWVRPFRTKAMPFSIIVSLTMWVLHAIVTRVMPPVGLRFRPGTWSGRVVTGQKFYRWPSVPWA
jgi:hypothetical protein